MPSPPETQTERTCARHESACRKNALASIIAYLLIGALVMAGMKAADWLIPPPIEKVRLLVCVADSDGSVGECGPFSRFFENAEAAQP